MRIVSIQGREILDSRGNPTVEADVILEDGSFGRASVPSGASTGKNEAVELRDKDLKRYLGKGVEKAVSNINNIINPALNNRSIESPNSQAEMDKRLCELDGTKDKSALGANAILAVSLAIARARAQYESFPLFQSLHRFPLLCENKMCLPLPMMNILNGGAHANNNIDIQEFMIMPLGAATYKEALRMGVEIFHALKSVLNKEGYATSVGDEGGFAPNLNSNAHALDSMSESVLKAGFKLGKEVAFALDVAASELFDEGRYHLKSENKICTSLEMIQYYKKLINAYPIISIEDGLAEDDWQGWQALTEQLGDLIQLVGDDLLVTNPLRLKKAIETHTANAILIKLNQIGTLTETLEAMHMAKEAGYHAIVSHRSGETEDSFIADLAVATGCGQIKTGSLCRTDRTAKYNQLLRIADLIDLPLAKWLGE